jgi:hypothetical protein
VLAWFGQSARNSVSAVSGFAAGDAVVQRWAEAINPTYVPTLRGIPEVPSTRVTVKLPYKGGVIFDAMAGDQFTLDLTPARSHDQG